MERPINGILIIDKPRDWTSHDVVGKMRGVLHVKRIGHSGTLDPMATGVLPVFVGRATRAIEFCEADEKEYIAELIFGVETDTQDTTGNVVTTRACQVTREELEAVLPKFRGSIQQIPPMYSAIKIQGKKLYELARKGVEVERKPREVEIRCLEILDFGENKARLRVVCSKGTYIRSLCADIGGAIGCGAAMSALRRVRAGSFKIEDSVSMTEAIEKGTALLAPVDRLFDHFPACTITEKQEQKCRCGNDFSLKLPENGTYRVYGENSGFLMLGQYTDGIMHTVKSFFEVN